ncbi:hypothetical protein HOT57_gp27 [Pseudomonas phage phCDa]|uniref:Uncharacterized protein n=1 Tax=Pseudomonas phage phCDa TaxID=2268587 RepID=A0A2Z5H8H8_9CAUD|nr:hypothetical protein HOT57_gp27 [Pseudomonas phage phCDa]AXC36471.1 hypothetical protein phCDa_27 [Pseudomonas phage phCDa]
MEYMLLVDGSVNVTLELPNRAAVMSALISEGGDAHYWREPGGRWCCIKNTGVFKGLDDVDVAIKYVDVPDVVKLAVMLE